MSRWVLAGSLVLAACGSSPGGGGALPIVQSFVATPPLVIGDGGVVELRWSISGADSVRIDPGVGPVTPVSAGTISPHVIGTTHFTLTASGPGGDALGTTQVQVCDPAPGTLSGSCAIHSNSTCADYSGLGYSDRDALFAFYNGKGIWESGTCPAGNRIGSCQYPPGQFPVGIPISCSATAVMVMHVYPGSTGVGDPNIPAMKAACEAAGGIFTPD
jgi:hypothetical protein